MKKAPTIIVACLLLTIGVLIFFYPLISANVSENKSKTAIENFENYKTVHTQKGGFDNSDADGTDKSAADMTGVDSAPSSDEVLSKLREEMQKYNKDIYKNKQSGLCDAWAYEQASVDLSEYGLAGCPVGVLRVPTMNGLEMPVYLGASKDNMSNGAAQLGETSMPVGGNNTNCVIAGHRGWNGARYFLDIEQLREGDKVYIENFWETLTYTVTDIKVIDPDDIDTVCIQPDKDMLTLITCHPYWASTYRYAVFCTRSEEWQKTPSDDSEADETFQKETAAADFASTVGTELDTVFESSGSRIMAEQVSYFVIPTVLILFAVTAFVLYRR